MKHWTEEMQYASGEQRLCKIVNRPEFLRLVRKRTATPRNVKRRVLALSVWRINLPVLWSPPEGGGMTGLALYHRAPARNMQRFYRLDVQPDVSIR